MGTRFLVALLLVCGGLVVSAGQAAAAPTCLGRAATIVGSDGDDTLRGTRGNDVIVGRGGNDRIFAGAGNDRVCGGSGLSFIRGGPGHDRIMGGPGSDNIDGQAGNDRIRGMDLSASSELGTNVLHGGPGDDRVVSVRAWRDYLGGDAGADVLLSSTFEVRIVGGTGDDRIVIDLGTRRYGYASISAGLGNDTVSVTPIVNRIQIDNFCVDYNESPRPIVADLTSGVVTGEGRDHLSGIQCIHGSAFGDRLAGSEFREILYGHGGADELVGRGHCDYLEGGPGADELDVGQSCRGVSSWGNWGAGGPGVDVLLGGPGVDLLDGGTGPDNISAAGGDDLLVGDDYDIGDYDSSSNTLTAGPGSDRVLGGFGSDEIRGGLGDDKIFGDNGDDTIDAGPGSDLIRGGRHVVGDTCANAETMSGCEFF